MTRWFVAFLGSAILFGFAHLPSALAVCGDGILDMGEQCDDGNTNDGDGCNFECKLEENCSNMIDDDGDGLTDCEDAECAGSPDCSEIGRDPAAITFRPTRPGRDLFVMHGRIEPAPGFDPSSQDVKVMLSNADGVIYRADLAPGDMVAQGANRFAFRDRRAASGNGSHGGLERIRIAGHNGAYLLAIKAYGDFAAATLPTMYLEVTIGDKAFWNKSTWRAKRNGWRLDLLPIVPH